MHFISVCLSFVVIHSLIYCDTDIIMNLKFGICLSIFLLHVGHVVTSEHGPILFDGDSDQILSHQNTSKIISTFVILREQRFGKKSSLGNGISKSYGIYLAIFLIMSGDIELNPGPVNMCKICCKLVRRMDKAVQCDDCSEWIHARCSGIDSKAYRILQGSEEEWFCEKCASPCKICHEFVHSWDNGIQCDACDLWLHVRCVMLDSPGYKKAQETSCVWVCPACPNQNLDRILNTSTMETLNSKNRFNLLNTLPAEEVEINASRDVVVNKKTEQNGKSLYNVGKVRKLKFVSININGIIDKKLELQSFLVSHNVDIAAIQESKIDSSVKNSELFSSELGYDVFRNDRVMGGGGTMLVVKSELKPSPLSCLENGSESVWAKISINGKDHFLGSWYRSPEDPCENIQLLADQFKIIKSEYNKNNHPCIHVLGDFNYSKIDWPSKLNKLTMQDPSNVDGKRFIDIIDDYGADQLVSFPTRGPNILDLLVSTTPDRFVEIHSPDRFSDHDVVMGTLLCTAYSKRPICKYFLYSKGDYNKMKGEVREFVNGIYLNGHQDGRSIDENWNLFKDFLIASIARNVPQKTSKPNKSLPWLSNQVRSMIRRRNKIHRRYKETGSDEYKILWRSLRSTIKKNLFKLHQNFINKMIGDVKQNPRPFWKYINSKKSERHNIPTLWSADHSAKAETDEEKADFLNTQFSSVFTQTVFDSTPFKLPSFERMGTIQVERAGVKKLLEGLNINKSMGPDNLHPRVLRELAGEIDGVLTQLFQQSLDRGQIPEDWKMANICPLFKKNDKSLPSNYRPISLTCICSKLLEHIVCSSLMKHLDAHGILTERQHAFRRNHSCDSQLVTVVDDWALSMDRGKQVDVFILDFEKAFDTVPHEQLLFKLHQCGTSKQLLNWVSQFLTNRRQAVMVNGARSSEQKVISGVPQGTVIGPLLFLVHINDIVPCISSEIRLFADDCVCYRVIDKKSDCFKLQEDIDSLGRWARDWGMRFQPSKCNVMRIISKRKQPVDFSYMLEGSDLKFVNEIKYLGVYISSNLNWNRHISETCNKATRTLGLLRRNLHSCPREVKMLAYKGLIRPVLEYAASVWDPHQEYLKSKVESVQNRACRFIASDYSMEPGSMTRIRTSLEIESLEERRRVSRLILFYKGLNSRSSLPLEILRVPDRRTRHMHSQHYIQVGARGDIYKNSFIPKTLKDWNQLSEDLLLEADSATNNVDKFINLIRTTE